MIYVNVSDLFEAAGNAGFDGGCAGKGYTASNHRGPMGMFKSLGRVWGDNVLRREDSQLLRIFETDLREPLTVLAYASLSPS